MLFTADTEYHDIEIIDDYFVVPSSDELETTEGWQYTKDLETGNKIVTDEGIVLLINKVYNDSTKDYKLFVRRI
jgi:hypothetical protein